MNDLEIFHCLQEAIQAGECCTPQPAAHLIPLDKLVNAVRILMPVLISEKVRHALAILLGLMLEFHARKNAVTKIKNSRVGDDSLVLKIWAMHTCRQSSQ